VLVVMLRQATAAEIQFVVDRVREVGLSPELSTGADAAVIGVVGRDADKHRAKFTHLPGVQEIVRITKPYELASREFRPRDTTVCVDGVVVGARDLVVMAGPCSVESEEMVVDTARFVAAQGATVLRGGAFKPRTSPYSFMGLGELGLRMLATARAETGLPVVSEVLTPHDVELVARYANMLQIGTRNMQNYALLQEVGRSRTPVLLKRGMSSTVEEWLLAAEYILSCGNPNVVLCERGIRTFERSTRFTLDLNSVALARRLSHLPVVVDPSHGTGRSELVRPMSLAAVGAGARGLLIEVHPRPTEALSDGEQSLDFEEFAGLMRALTDAFRPDPVRLLHEAAS
jgi:3-deoxy-7-phosphoheptulonate synthase